jgi:ribosome biogenesis protein MAK21
MGKKRKRSTKDPESTSSAVQLPSFDESALSALTNKIESGFRNAASPRQDPRNRNPLPSENPRDRIGRAQKAKSDTKDRVSGKNYHAQGIVLEQTGSSSTISKSRANRRNGENEEEQNVLLQEILALGGTEDDLELIMGVVSDDEDVGQDGLEQTPSIDPKLTKELSKYITSLGIESRDIEDSESIEDVDDDQSEDVLDMFKSKLTNDVKDVMSSDLQVVKNSAKRPKDLVSKSPPLEAGYIVLTEAPDV